MQTVLTDFFNGRMAIGLKRLMLVAIALLSVGCTKFFLPPLEANPWQTIALETDATFSDVAFAAEADHGWLVGSRSSLFETTDGGQTWEQKVLDLGDQRYTFTSVSFNGDEGWVAGLPSVLLHTTDGGKSWANIPLSAQLPGGPLVVTAMAKGSVEMATDVGAIYRTDDSGRHWTALVQAAVGVVRNMTRSEDGRYVAVSSRGNFYSTWEPGQESWQPHNRENSKRLQNMGFSSNGNLWLIARGGQMQFGQPNESPEVPKYETWSDPLQPELGSSWGFLDVGYRTDDEVWVSGGSGTLLMSPDGGETWLKDEPAGDVPSNLYRIKFFGTDQGFILGQRGYLLRYLGEKAAA
ncbi:photosynthesis system II assembly factor Ycf48 [Leptolyngbya cf. ectocarpi LEGE 11479]|uniref:Photosystem II assembly protein Ycf48 n=1 Tax=Leptolyngbya cf. ectocarpi LEGE 11479 TaxID=1828722 RepID=A0A928ZXL0_LEPEC|nr:photosynthesis system II assembly factor Ycf48 [Leptolyngbya ectocarpi]MBE9069298.1 photosynthesis system II assembly factor Ycf48 [Leptolyngbya cf. ectocarpi LEGE 11479]